MRDPFCIIGIGEMAGVFARGLLRRGHPLYPVTRGMDLEAVAAAIPSPRRVLVAVAEKDLHPVLAAVPEAWRDRLVLLQNELLPRDWRAHGISETTVVVVWFEKKPGREVKVILPSPVYGPGAEDVLGALEALDIPCRRLPDAEALLFELVRKNLYILTTNIAGLEVDGTVGTLWEAHRPLAEAVAQEILDVQARLAGVPLDRARLLAGLEEAIAADPTHACRGRSAPQRLARTLAQAREAGLAVPRLEAIAARHPA